jgi:hypothetical protein
MTDPEPTPAADQAPWEVKQREYDRLAAELLAVNKTALFTALAAAGIEIVTVTFDGYGDSGQIEAIESSVGDAHRDLPAVHIELARHDWGSPDVHRHHHTVQEAIETLVFALLGEAHGGWENNDGAYGDFTFDVAKRTITLDYNERLTASEYSQHVF